MDMKDVKMIGAGVRQLPNQDRPPQIMLPPDSQGCRLVITRNGNTELLRISKRVAEELIAANFSWEG